jgi:uncharacterized protein (DUF58 family)
VTTSASPKLVGYACFAAVAFLAALVLGRPEFAALGAPFVVYLLLATTLARPVDQHVRFALERESAVEGDELPSTLGVSARSRWTDAELQLLMPDGVVAVEGAHFRIGGDREIGAELIAERWGAYRLGEVAIRSRDPLGLLVFDARILPSLLLRVYPKEEQLKRLVVPWETQPYFGNRVARVKGDGIEFADIRPFVAGDRPRRINWRVSTRRQGLYVNETSAERNADVVLFLDSFAEARHAGSGTLDLAARAAASLARAYLEERDRVGLVGFGAVLRWLTPATGRRQLQQIVDALLETGIGLSYAWKGIDVVPPRSLPPQALVIALSPLLDERSVEALFDLRMRGFDLVVVDLSPLPFSPAGGDASDVLAYRLWRLWREALRYRYEKVGVPVVEWNKPESLVGVIEQARAVRRHGRLAHV